MIEIVQTWGLNMQISGTSNTGFGKIYWKDTEIHSTAKMTPFDIKRVKDLFSALNADAARHISVYAEIGKPDVLGNRKGIRVMTSPTPVDMAVLRVFRPGAERNEYKRRSHWFRLYDRDLYDKLSGFIHGQRGYIHHCTIDPKHNSKPFGVPMWRHGANTRRPLLGDF